MSKVLPFPRRFWCIPNLADEAYAQSVRDNIERLQFREEELIDLILHPRFGLLPSDDEIEAHRQNVAELKTVRLALRGPNGREGLQGELALCTENWAALPDHYAPHPLELEPDEAEKFQAEHVQSFREC